MHLRFSLGLATGRCAKARITKVFLWMIIDEGKSMVLLGPKTSLVRLDDGESSLEWCERWTCGLNLGGMTSFE